MSLSARRAWIEIEVIAEMFNQVARSLSARRAWIEILYPLAILSNSQVALRKESVDRNNVRSRFFDCAGGSLSARRAWIEIGAYAADPTGKMRRSPQGERG